MVRAAKYQDIWFRVTDFFLKKKLYLNAQLAHIHSGIQLAHIHIEHAPCPNPIGGCKMPRYFPK
jgi:hypothetical protein